MHPSSTNRLATLAACACILPALMAPFPAGAQQFAEPPEPAEITLSPASPSAFFPDAGQENRLAPSTTMLFIVTIAKTGRDKGHDYELSGEPEFNPGVDVGVADDLWTKGALHDSADQMVQQYLLTNASPVFAHATLTVSCVWTPVTGYGGGSGPRPDDIPGAAYAQAYLEQPVVEWQFERHVAVYNLTDHFPEDRQLPFTLSFEDTVGRLLSSDHITNVSFSFVGDPPPGQGSGVSGLFVQLTEQLEPFTSFIRAYIDALDPTLGGKGTPSVEFRAGSLNAAVYDEPAVLAAVEHAPAVLPVNSNFDLGAINENTYFAKPDHMTRTLKAARDHLDGLWQAGDLVVNDLHEGFFGLRPGWRPYAETSGAQVTIRKLDRIDPQTGELESGHVRMYGVIGSSPNQTDVVIDLYDQETLEPLNLGPMLYKHAPLVAVNYYLEGTAPGKITLEFSYEQGGVTIKHEQQFLVATLKTPEEWREEIRNQIRLQESELETATIPGNFETDITRIDPDNGFRDPNRGRPISC